MKCEYCGAEGARLEWEAEFNVKSYWNYAGTPTLHFCGQDCLINWMFDDGLLRWKEEKK